MNLILSYKGFMIIKNTFFSFKLSSLVFGVVVKVIMLNDILKFIVDMKFKVNIQI